MRKTPLTCFGKVGTDWLRITAAILETGAYAFVRADGTNAIVPVLPHVFRTSGDMANVTATLGHKVNMSAVPSVGLPAHTWKGTFDLVGIAAHMGASDAVVAGLIAAYADEAEIAA